MTVINSRNPIARINHTCDFCNWKIEKGEKYHYATNRYEGLLYSWKSHLSCMELIDVLKMEGCGEGITSDEFCEYVNDAFDDLNLQGGKTFKERIKMIKSLYIKSKN